ncbi:hypothetical protein NQ318_011141 [Aromia moschata]|uniref:Uncharacterized protein n=1 Tax=Aromia moschata TaxID=1265417 RepID=A0AAV8X154_9CUCU|nr:hypothetical protein NQ318_011141 [Aromia moschata]
MICPASQFEINDDLTRTQTSSGSWTSEAGMRGAGDEMVERNADCAGMLFPAKVNAWAGIMGNHLVGPVFLDTNLTGEVYRDVTKRN